MGILLAAIAAFFCAFSNLCMRRSIDHGGTTKAFLVIQFFSAIFLMILLNPVRTGSYDVNIPITILAIIEGVVLALMLFFIGKALEKGPPGLTFAALNGSTVMPAIVMATVFGAALGHTYSMYHAIGSLLVLLGLFWAGRSLVGMKDLRQWALFVTFAFGLHIVFLVVTQWRVLQFSNPNLPEIFRLMSAQDAQSQWFLPLIYLGAFFFQFFVFTLSEKRLPNSSEAGYGVLGGICNGASTFFLIQSTEFASTIENAMIFPVFSVLTIVYCNLWGKYLYKEQVNWKAAQVCMLGLVIGTVNWETILKVFGF